MAGASHHSDVGWSCTLQLALATKNVEVPKREGAPERASLKSVLGLESERNRELKIEYM
jgi:hypothetical protein